MATSGQVNSTTVLNGTYLYVKWTRTGTWNEQTCGSNIKWELWLYNRNYFYSNAIKCYDIYIDGVKVSSGGTWSNYTSYGEFKLLEGTTNVQHANNGTKTFNINFTGWFYANHNVSGTGDFTLDTIPRASTFTTSGNTIGSNINVSITRADNSFTHRVTLAFGNLTPEVKTNIGTSTTFTPSLSDYGSQIPNAMSGTATMIVETYSGNILIGSNSKTLTLNMPSSAKPTISNIALSEAVTGIASKFGTYIQKKSKIHGVVTASGIYGSTISSYVVEIDGRIFYTNEFTTNELSSSGTNLPCNVTITDSRGQSNTLTTTYNVLAYKDPHITKFTAQRNAITPTTLNCLFSIEITDLDSKNDHSIEIQLDGTTVYTNTTSYYLVDASTNIIDVSELTSHTLTLILTDYFHDTYNAVTLSIPIGTAFSLMNFSADGRHMAIGQVYDSTLDVDLQIGNSLGVGGVKALYKDSNNYLANNVYEYTETITSNSGDSTFIVTIKRVGSIVSVRVKATLSANAITDGAFKNFTNFPNWAKTAETENNIANGFTASNFGWSETSGISIGNFLSVQIFRISDTTYRFSGIIGKDNTTSSLTLYASMNYVIEQN